jgi:signal transduction histidine kinase
LVIKVGFYIGFGNHWQEISQPHITEYLNHLLAEIGTPPDITRAKAVTQRLPLDITIQGESVNWSSLQTPLKTGSLTFSTHTLTNGQEIHIAHPHGQFFIRANIGNTQITFQPRQSYSSAANWAAISTIAGVLLVLVLAYHAIGYLFRPIKSIREGLARFGSGDLTYRINLQCRDEFGDLSKSVNTMANEIQQMLEAKRQLLLAISHELRSPLTRAIVNLELIQPASSARSALKTDLNEIETLLTELLESERLNSSHAALDRSAVTPASLITEVINEHFKHEGIHIHPGSDNDYVSLDAPRIKTLIRNLLDNAIQHTPDDAPTPTITSTLTIHHWRLTVQNQGLIIPIEHLPHLTEPFYRADPSRRRHTGGYGLGLYLCRMIAQAHGGTLDVSSNRKGTQISVTVPLN